MQPKFQLGQQVKAIALPNAFPNPTQERCGLIITDVRLIECLYMPNYYRFVASEPNGFGYVEGSDQFFEAELS
jgi:hypothetical protein